MKNIYFYANCPEYRGAPLPSFKEKEVNVSEFDDDLRPKEEQLCVHLDESDPSKSYGDGEWLAQGSDHADSNFIEELKRAFAANGLPPGCEANVKFGIRDDGLTQLLTFTV